MIMDSKSNTVKDDNRDITKFSESFMIAEEVQDVHSPKDLGNKNVKPAMLKTPGWFNRGVPFCQVKSLP